MSKERHQKPDVPEDNLMAKLLREEDQPLLPDKRLRPVVGAVLSDAEEVLNIAEGGDIRGRVRQEGLAENYPTLAGEPVPREMLSTIAYRLFSQAYYNPGAEGIVSWDNKQEGLQGMLRVIQFCLETNIPFVQMSTNPPTWLSWAEIENHLRQSDYFTLLAEQHRLMLGMSLSTEQRQALENLRRELERMLAHKPT